MELKIKVKEARLNISERLSVILERLCACVCAGVSVDSNHVSSSSLLLFVKKKSDIQL